MVTKQVCLQGFVSKYPGATSLVAQQSAFFDRALRALLSKAEFRQSSVPFTGIVAGTYEYPWSETSVQALQATWYDSATSFWGLGFTSEASLRDTNPGWPATIRSGSPRRFYISARTTGLVIGFDQNPNVSTSGGYPNVLVQTEDSTALGLSDTIPPSLLDEMPLVYRMCQYWAEDHDIGKAAYWEKRADDGDAMAIKHLRTMIPALPEEQHLPPFGPFSRKII